jgi:hypothetical protein
MKEDDEEHVGRMGHPNRPSDFEIEFWEIMTTAAKSRDHTALVHISCVLRVIIPLTRRCFVCPHTRLSQLDKYDKATHRHSLSTPSFCGPFLLRTGPYAIVIVIGIEMDPRVTAVVLYFHLHLDLVPESCS